MRLRFDRGTIVLQGVPPDLPVAELPGLRWDPRVGLWRAPAYRYRALQAELRRRRLTVDDEVAATAPSPAPWRPVSLRPYQEAALDAWSLAGCRGVVALPTGSGKTRVAEAAIARSRLRTLCLAPTRALVDQWRGVLASSYGGPVGCYGDGVRVLQPVTVATFESAYRHMARLGDQFDLVVVDEAHHLEQGEREEALEMAVARARLGLTATPSRDPAASRRRARLIGPVVYELGIADLAGTYLAELEYVILPLDLTDQERRDYSACMAQFRPLYAALGPAASRGSAASRGGWAELSRLARLLPEGRQALDALRRARRLLAYTRAKADMLGALLQRHRTSRVLVFTADNPTAYAVAREHLVAPLTCDVGRTERREVLRRFRDGELRALVSTRVLNEGLDVPDADVAVIVGGSAGAREHVQRVGRLLRPGDGKSAVVYELVTRGTLEVQQSRRRERGLAARVSAPL